MVEEAGALASMVMVVVAVVAKRMAVVVVGCLDWDLPAKTSSNPPPNSPTASTESLPEAGPDPKQRVSED